MDMIADEILFDPNFGANDGMSDPFRSDSGRTADDILFDPNIRSNDGMFDSFPNDSKNKGFEPN